MASATLAMSGPSALGELPDHRLEGERHVGAGVTVGDRVDVEPVDLLLVGAQGVPVGRDNRRPDSPAVQALQRPHSGDANAGGPAWDRLRANRVEVVVCVDGSGL